MEKQFCDLKDSLCSFPALTIYAILLAEGHSYPWYWSCTYSYPGWSSYLLPSIPASHYRREEIAARYSATELEALAVINMVEHFGYHLLCYRIGGSCGGQHGGAL